MDLQQVLHLLQLRRADRAALKDQRVFHCRTLRQGSRRVQQKIGIVCARSRYRSQPLSTANEIDLNSYVVSLNPAQTKALKKAQKDQDLRS